MYKSTIAFIAVILLTICICVVGFLGFGLMLKLILMAFSFIFAHMFGCFVIFCIFCLIISGCIFVICNGGI